MFKRFFSRKPSADSVEWCFIPSGKVSLIAGGYLSAPREFNLPAFEIAKYPVTNAQFAKFIAAGGYHNAAWWTPSGWQACQEGWHYDKLWKVSGKAWTEPRYWHEPKFNQARQPVVGISWHEAVAFCQWYAAQTGDKIRLAREEQWQRAVQASPDGQDTGWFYPWGNTWDVEKCNNGAEGLKHKQSTGVDYYEERGNISPCCVVDLIGNVWEWCLTEHETGGAELDNLNVRSLRGGSWANLQTKYFACTYRYWSYPNYRHHDWGFRLVRLPN